MKNEWKLLKVDGWRAFMLKENLKLLKQKLNEWNKNHCGNLDRQIVEIKCKLEVCDLKGEES